MTELTPETQAVVDAYEQTTDKYAALAMDPSNSPSKMTDTERIHKVIDIVFNTHDEDWNETVDAIYSCVRDTDYYNQLKEQKERKLAQLKKDLASLSDADKKLLGL